MDQVVSDCPAACWLCVKYSFVIDGRVASGDTIPMTIINGSKARSHLMRASGLSRGIDLRFYRWWWARVRRSTLQVLLKVVVSRGRAGVAAARAMRCPAEKNLTIANRKPNALGGRYQRTRVGINTESLGRSSSFFNPVRIGGPRCTDLIVFFGHLVHYSQC